MVRSFPMFARYLLNTLLEQLVPKSRWVSIPVWETLKNCKNIPLSSCKKWYFCDQPKHNWYKITVRLRLREIWSSEWWEEVMQANIKLKQFAAPRWEQNFKNSIGSYMVSWLQCFSLLLWIFIWKEKREWFIRGFHISGKWLLKCVSKIIKLNKIKDTII